MSFQIYKMGNKVVAIIDADSSCEISLHGARINGTLGGQPISGSGSAEYLKQTAVGGLPGTGASLVSAPAQITESFTFVPGVNGKGSLNIQCSGTRDASNDAAGTFQGQVVKGHSLNFDLKNQTTPIQVSIVQKLS